MEYDKLNLRFPWRFFQRKNIITADSILYGTRNLERKYCKGLQQRKSSLTKRQRKDFEPMSLWIKWKKKFSISKNQACQHKHFIARRKELSFKKPLPGRGLEKKNQKKKQTKKNNHYSILAGPHYWYQTPDKPHQNHLNSSSWAEEHTSCSTYYEDLFGGYQKSHTIPIHNKPPIQNNIRKRYAKSNNFVNTLTDIQVANLLRKFWSSTNSYYKIICLHSFLKKSFNIKTAIS